MALITDPDDLIDSAADDDSTEVYINTSTQRIKLVKVGDLSDDGVTLKALYSFLKEQWKTDPNSKNLAAFPFPMVPITDESFEFVDGWDFENDLARYLIRTAGWTVRNTAGAATQRWSGVIGLGAIGPSDQLYYFQGGTSPITDVVLTGQVNQAVQIYRDDNGDGIIAGDDFDRRTTFNLYVREQGQVFGSSALSDIGVTTLDSIAYRFPISTAVDLNIDTIDTDIKVSGTGFPADEAPYSGMTITYHATPQSKAGLTDGPYEFGIVIDGNGATLREVYNFVQYALRQDDDINATSPPVVTGSIASALLFYVGDTLFTASAINPAGGGTGVFIENFDANDLNRIEFTDNAGTIVQYPFVATITLQFNNNLTSDPDAVYWLYYSTLPVVGRTVADAAITAATTTLTSATAAFVANDLDALVLVAGAGAAGADLVARIASVTSGTEVELDTAAGTTVSGASLEIFGGDWGERGALIVDDNDAADIAGAVSSPSISRTYDFDGNTQGGRVPPAVPAVTAVAIGLETGQYVRATGTIARSTANAIALVAPLERNYENPA